MPKILNQFKKPKFKPIVCIHIHTHRHKESEREP